MQGPLIVEDMDATTVVPPGATCHLDALGQPADHEPRLMTDQTTALRDPITFEVVKNAFIALADELAITVVRTAHSQVVRDSMDFSTAICDARGRVVAQGLGIPLHLGAIPDAMDALLNRFDGDIGPGDVFAFNDPDEGGMHLPDIFVIKPVFAREELVGYAACVAHHADIGGRMPGGNAVDSTEIFQEGLQIPLLKLYEGGRLNETLMTLLMRNVRIPAVVRGDLDAQLAACHTGEAGLLELVDRYTAAGVSALADEILDYTEGLVRAEIIRIPDGEYTFQDHIDDDGFGSGPIPIRVTLTISGDELTADFTGTSPQVRSALNATPSFAKSAVYAGLKCVLPSDIPSNAGFQRPVSVRIPEGSILRPRRPAPRAARGLTGFRTLDAVLGALAQAVPDRVAAAGEGGATMIAIGGTHADGEAFVFVDFMCGGWGARPDRDGIDGDQRPGREPRQRAGRGDRARPARARPPLRLPPRHGRARALARLPQRRARVRVPGGARPAAGALGPP